MDGTAEESGDVRSVERWYVAQQHFVMPRHARRVRGNAIEDRVCAEPGRRRDHVRRAAMTRDRRRREPARAGNVDRRTELAVMLVDAAVRLLRVACTAHMRRIVRGTEDVVVDVA